MEFIDICAGIGGFRSGLEKAGHTCIGYVEIDKHARKSYQAMYDTTDEWTAHDITALQPDDIPKADLWCFGFPCQDISISGKQKGLKGERSGIFYSIIELIKGKDTKDKPRWLLIENVKNLLSLHEGGEFTEVLTEISEAGYDAEWHLINSKDYGVPQNRERVFIIGRLREGSRSEVLPLSRESKSTGRETQSTQQTQGRQEKPKRQIDRFNHMIGNRKYQSSHVYGVEGVSRACMTNSEIYYAVPKLQKVIDGNQSNRVYDSNGLSKTLTGECGGGGAQTGYYTIPKTNALISGKHSGDVVLKDDSISRALLANDSSHPQNVAVPKIKTIIKSNHQRGDVQDLSGLARTLTVTDYKGPQQIAVPCITPDRVNKRQNGRRFKENNDPMFTLTVQDRHGVLLYDGKEYYIRKLTPKECFRLQGFTDEQFEKAAAVNSNTQLYKQAGNAVTVNVAEFLGGVLKDAEESII